MNSPIQAGDLCRVVWGALGSASPNIGLIVKVIAFLGEHSKYAEPAPSTSRRRCHCGCGLRASHRGMANGVCLVLACELGVRRWIKTGYVRVSRKIKVQPGGEPR